MEDERTTHNPYIHRTLADGFADLIFHYKGTFDELTSQGKIERSFTLGIHGQSQNYRRFLIKENFGIFGVYLYPFSIPQFFTLPATELSNEMPGLETLLGERENFLNKE